MTELHISVYDPDDWDKLNTWLLEEEFLCDYVSNEEQRVFIKSSMASCCRIRQWVAKNMLPWDWSFSMRVIERHNRIASCNKQSWLLCNDPGIDNPIWVWGCRAARTYLGY